MKVAFTSLLISMVFAAPAFAQTKADPHAGHHPPTSAASSVAELTDAEVRKVDTAASKITLKHGEIKNLGMPPMTMVFGVADKAMLERVKVGDKVKFKASNDAGKLTLTELQPVR